EGPPGTGGHTVLAPLKNVETDMAFEIVFHEASHTVDEGIMKRLAREGKVPEDLWHAVIFYTSGELARRELGKGNDPSYRPYAYRFQVYERGEWRKFRAALERDWLPYLDGKTSFDAAVSALVRDAQ